MDWKWIFSKELSKKQKGIGKGVEMKSKFGNVISSCFWKRQFHEIHNFMNPQELFTILLISFLHANSGSLESIDVTVMPIVSGYFL